jgi:uncharacterized membrane protein
MKKYFIFNLMIFSLFGCNYNRVKGNSDLSANPENLHSASFEAFDYSSIKASVLDVSCVGCHSNAGGNQGGLNLESYDNVKAASAKIYYRTIEAKNMPPVAVLSESSFGLLKNWIEIGAPEKSTTKRQLKFSGPLNWAVIKDLVLQPNCLQCHSQPDPVQNLDLSSYSVFVSNIGKIIDRAIVKQDMPISPYPNLSAQEKELLLKWISEGMPQ